MVSSLGITNTFRWLFRKMYPITQAPRYILKVYWIPYTNRKRYCYCLLQGIGNLKWTYSILFFFNYGIIALQCCTGFCHTTCESAISIHMTTPSWISHIPPTPSYPSRLSQSTNFSSLHHTEISTGNLVFPYGNSIDYWFGSKHRAFYLWPVMAPVWLSCLSSYHSPCSFRCSKNFPCMDLLN